MRPTLVPWILLFVPNLSFSTNAPFLDNELATNHVGKISRQEGQARLLSLTNGGDITGGKSNFCISTERCQIGTFFKSLLQVHCLRFRCMALKSGVANLGFGAKSWLCWRRRSWHRQARDPLKTFYSLTFSHGPTTWKCVFGTWCGQPPLQQG